MRPICPERNRTNSVLKRLAFPLALRMRQRKKRWTLMVNNCGREVVHLGQAVSILIRCHIAGDY
jgi:hypothetical protein